MSKINISHFSITQSAAIAAFTFIVGQVVAFVPSLGTDKQNLISAGTTVIAAVFMVVNGLHTNATAKVSAAAVAAAPLSAGTPPAVKPAPVATSTTI